MKQKNVTIKEVAKLAGVSIATVSRVVNGNYYVGPEITQRVNDAIVRLNYQPNFFARSLKGANSLMIAVIVSDIANEYYNFVTRAIEDVVWPQEYNLFFSSTQGNSERELITVNALVNKKIDGMILNTTGHNDKILVTISQLMPMVLLHRRLKSRGFRGDFVDSDNRFGAAELTRHLQAAGHTRIGAINGLLNLSAGQERFEGFCIAMGASGVKITADSEDVFNGDFTANSGYEGMKYFHTERPDITGVIVMNNTMTIGAMRYLREHRIRVPEEISIVCYGDIMNHDIMYVRPTIVSLDPQTIGVKAAGFIISRIERPELKNRQYLFQPELNPGESVSAPVSTFPKR